MRARTGPAWEHGLIRKGDRIVAVDGKNVRDWEIQDIQRHMCGEEGTSVTLDISVKPRTLAGAGVGSPRVWMMNEGADSSLFTHQVTLVRRPLSRNAELEDLLIQVVAGLESQSRGFPSSDHPWIFDCRMPSGCWPAFLTPCVRLCLQVVTSQQPDEGCDAPNPFGTIERDTGAAGEVPSQDGVGEHQGLGGVAGINAAAAKEELELLMAFGDIPHVPHVDRAGSHSLVTAHVPTPPEAPASQVSRLSRVDVGAGTVQGMDSESRLRQPIRGDEVDGQTRPAAPMSWGWGSAFSSPNSRRREVTGLSSSARASPEKLPKVLNPPRPSPPPTPATEGRVTTQQAVEARALPLSSDGVAGLTGGARSILGGEDQAVDVQRFAAKPDTDAENLTLC